MVERAAQDSELESQYGPGIWRPAYTEQASNQNLQRMGTLLSITTPIEDRSYANPELSWIRRGRETSTPHSDETISLPLVSSHMLNEGMV